MGNRELVAQENQNNTLLLIVKIFDAVAQKLILFTQKLSGLFKAIFVAYLKSTLNQLN